MTNPASHAVGSIEVICLSDGDGEFEEGLFSGAEPSEIRDLLGNANKSKIQTNFNALLIRDEHGSTLVDTGLRGLAGPSTGHLPAALKSVGVNSSDIDRLILTHLHPDHIAGAVTPDGDAVFESSEVFITSDEIDFWSDPDNFQDENSRNFQQLAVSVLSAYEGRISNVGKDASVAPGISLIDLPGHTPGHVGVFIESSDHNFIFATDIFHAQDIQFANPGISIAFDTDKELAIETRKRTLDMIACDRIFFAAGHTLDAKIGQLEKRGSGYAFVPAY